MLPTAPRRRFFVRCLALMFALCAPAFAVDGDIAHPCGAIAWLDEIRVLQADFERDRGKDATRTLLHATLADLLPVVDARLVVTRTGEGGTRWSVEWRDHGDAASPPPRAVTDAGDLRDLYRAVLGEACVLLRQNDPEKAGRWLSSSWRSLWPSFEKVFLARLRDPGAAFGFSDISLSIDSPSVKSSNESFSLQWLDQSFGIARLYLPDMRHRQSVNIDEGLFRLRAQAPIKTLILDLRGSGGGDLSLVENLLARFLPAGTLAYSVTDRQGKETEVRVKSTTTSADERDVRLIVLVSRSTRGAAELLAAALQGARRAELFGERTAGMASHKRVLKLSDKNSLIVSHALPRFPGQNSVSPFVVPTREVLAGQALEAALASLAEGGRHPANPFIRPDEHRAPLARAVLERRSEDAVRLIEADADVNVEASREGLNALLPRRCHAENSGQTPVVGYPLAIAAAALGLPKVLAALGERAAQNLRLTDSEGRNALAYAALQGYPNATRILLAHGLNPLHPAKRYPISSTPLALAVQQKHAEVVELLMAAITRVQLGHIAVSESVWTAALNADRPTLKALLERGANANYIARQGGTALIAAVESGQPELVRLLLDHGATVDDHLYRGFSVVQYAERNAAHDDPAAKKIPELIKQAPRVDRGWKKSAQTESIENIWQMIENAERPKDQIP